MDSNDSVKEEDYFLRGMEAKYVVVDECLISFEHHHSMVKDKTVSALYTYKDFLCKSHHIENRLYHV